MLKIIFNKHNKNHAPSLFTQCTFTDKDSPGDKQQFTVSLTKWLHCAYEVSPPWGLMACVHRLQLWSVYAAIAKSIKDQFVLLDFIKKCEFCLTTDDLLLWWITSMTSFTLYDIKSADTDYLCLWMISAATALLKCQWLQRIVFNI